VPRKPTCKTTITNARCKAPVRRRQQEKREAEKQQAEDERTKLEDAAASAGIRQFGAGQAEALENAFKNETVGLVTKAEFMSKRSTLAERFQEDARTTKRAAEDAAALVRYFKPRPYSSEAVNPARSDFMDTR